VTVVSIIIEILFPLVCKMLPLICDLGQHFKNFGSKIFNDHLNASHYLYTDSMSVSF